MSLLHEDLPGEAEGRRLLSAARSALIEHYRVAPPEPVSVEWGSPIGGVFATVKIDGELRGCIGYLRAEADLVTLTRRAAVAAAMDDPRFGPVRREELSRLRLTVTVLAKPEPLGDPSEIEIGRHGLLVERGGLRGLLLPQVASERGWEAERFLSETCRKAGLAPESWRERETRVERFAAVHFEE